MTENQRKAYDKFKSKVKAFSSTPTLPPFSTILALGVEAENVRKLFDAKTDQKQVSELTALLRKIDDLMRACNEAFKHKKALGSLLN